LADRATAFQVGQTVSQPFTITTEDMRLFQRLSGDDSSIHTDEVFATDHGFKGVIVYGGLMLAHLSKVLGTIVPGRRGLSMTWSIAYRKPLYVDEPAILSASVAHVSEATNTVNLAFTITRDGEVIATGKTESLILK
jgi:acyl dehydratase